MKNLLLIPFILLPLFKYNAAFAYVDFDNQADIVISDTISYDEKDNINNCDEEIPRCKIRNHGVHWVVEFKGITGDARFQYDSSDEALTKRKDLMAQGLCQ